MLAKKNRTDRQCVRRTNKTVPLSSLSFCMQYKNQPATNDSTNDVETRCRQKRDYDAIADRRDCKALRIRCCVAVDWVGGSGWVFLGSAEESDFSVARGIATTMTTTTTRTSLMLRLLHSMCSKGDDATDLPHYFRSFRSVRCVRFVENRSDAVDTTQENVAVARLRVFSMFRCWTMLGRCKTKNAEEAHQPGPAYMRCMIR